jgi:hypothetical protein
MTPSEITLSPDYWQNFTIEEKDIEFVFNFLLEKETPLTSNELLTAIVQQRITEEKQKLISNLSKPSDIYRPKEKYSIGQTLIFQNLGNKRGEVIGSRPGINPEYLTFDVIEVNLDDGNTRFFAGSFPEHKLNTPVQIKENDPNLDNTQILNQYGDALRATLDQALKAKKDLVLIAGRWFPRSLLVDVNQGHLNLAEAILEEAKGGPLPISKIIDQADLPKDVNPQLLEFSLDLALQEDKRFDEVGPAGETLWFLQRLEPEGVQKRSTILNFPPFDYDAEKISNLLVPFESISTDEYEPGIDPGSSINKVQIGLIYPHWEAGTLPLTNQLKRLFPFAHEAPRIRFTFMDVEKNQRFNGWVVQPQKYIFGLKDWYQEQGLIPGSIVHLSKGQEPGVINLSIEKQRQNREWIRTTFIGSDGGLVFVMSKQPVTAAFDERLAFFVSDTDHLKQIWEKGFYQKLPMDQVVKQIMHELAKLNPQGQIHAQELYAAVNLVRRCPPGPILTILNSSAWSSYLGDLYFRLTDSTL